jgi:hypothetical protein
MRTTTLFMLSLAALYAAPAAAECAPRFTQATQTVNVNATDVGNSAVARENFDIRVGNDQTGPCSARLRFSRLTGGELRPDSGFQLASGNQEIDILPDESSAPLTKSDLFVPGIAGRSNGRAVPFRLTFATQWGVRSGVRQDEILVNLIDEGGVVVDTMILYVNFSVPDAVELRIVGATGNDRVAEIRLGRLDSTQTNRSDPFAIRVWSTSPYSIAFESENGGSLAKDGGSDRIPYILRLGGREVALNGVISESVGRATGALGDIHPVQVEVEPFVANAGDYADRVSVTVTAG